MTARHLDEQFAAFFRDSLPRVLEQQEETGRQSVQTVVWLVGLAAALLALLVTNLDELPFLDTGAVTAVIGLLTIVIVSGVGQRVLYHLAEATQRSLSWSLQGYLLGYTKQLEEPEELSDRWDEYEIVERLQSEFGLDYSFLLQYGASIDQCRKAYQAQLELWKSHDEERLETLGRIVAAYSGRPDEKATRMFTELQSMDKSLANVRRSAKYIRWLARAATVLFFACSLAFVAAVTIVALGAARSLS